MSLITDYLEEIGYKRQCSVTTCSEYYHKNDIKIRISDHRTDKNFNLDIQTVKNKRNEFIVYIKHLPHPINIKGIEELRQAIKWYAVFKNLYDNQIKFENSTAKEKIATKVKTLSKEDAKVVGIKTEHKVDIPLPTLQSPKIIGKVDLEDKKHPKIESIVKETEVDINNYKDIPVNINRIDIPRWENIREYNKKIEFRDRTKFYSQVSAGVIEYNNNIRFKGICSRSRISNVFYNVIGIQFTKIIRTSASRDIFFANISEFDSFLEIITFLMYHIELLKVKDDKQNNFSKESIKSELINIRKDVLNNLKPEEKPKEAIVKIVSPTSYTVLKDIPEIPIPKEDNSNIIKSTNSIIDDLLKEPTSSRGISWKDKMKIFIIKDFPQYDKFSVFIKNYIWRTIFKCKELTNYNDFYNIMLKCKESNFTFESFRENFLDFLSKHEK